MNKKKKTIMLLPCPLCGIGASITKLSPDGAVYDVRCGVLDDYLDGCHLVLYGGLGETRKAMIEKWNKRTS